MPHLKIQQDDARAIRLVHPHVLALAMGVVILALAWLAWTQMGPGFHRWVFGGALLLFGLLATVAGFQRDLIELRPDRRRWRRVKGSAFSTEETEGGLDDLDGVALELDWKSTKSSSSKGKVPVWEVGLVFDPGGKAVTFLQTRNEVEGYRELEAWAGRLGLDAIDRTGEGETRRAPDELDRPLGSEGVVSEDGGAPTWLDEVSPGAEHAAGGSGVAAGAGAPTRMEGLAPSPALPSPPPGSGVVLAGGGSEAEIQLPARGIDLTVIFLVLFGAAFAGMGAHSIHSGLGGSEDPLWVSLGGGVVFLLIGGGLARAVVRAALRRPWIREGASTLAVGYSLGGSDHERYRLHKREIEAVDVAGSTGKRARRGLGPVKDSTGARTGPPAEDDTVRIRTDEEIIRLGGHLSPEGKVWLRDVLVAIVSR